MIVSAMLASPLLVTFIDGRAAGLRSLRTLMLAVPLLLAGSAYWVVPAIIHLSTSIPSQLSGLADWTWAENRATIYNALWLNVHWAWNYLEYFPYARLYSQLPLSFARFLFPASPY